MGISALRAILDEKKKSSKGGVKDPYTALRSRYQVSFNEIRKALDSKNVALFKAQIAEREKLEKEIIDFIEGKDKKK
jgi:hypothetical protein